MCTTIDDLACTPCLNALDRQARHQRSLPWTALLNELLQSGWLPIDILMPCQYLSCLGIERSAYLQRLFQDLVTARPVIGVFSDQHKSLLQFFANGARQSGFKLVVGDLLVGRLLPTDFLNGVGDIGGRVPASGSVDVFAQELRLVEENARHKLPSVVGGIEQGHLRIWVQVPNQGISFVRLWLFVSTVVSRARWLCTGASTDLLHCSWDIGHEAPGIEERRWDILLADIFSHLGFTIEVREMG